MKQLFWVFLSVFATLETTASSFEYKVSSINSKFGVRPAILPDTGINTSSNQTTDFVRAAKATMPVVVHIKVRFNSSENSGASGSGVIISNDGYIATNNHVVDNASQISVTLSDKRTFKANLIGRDPIQIWHF